MTIFPSRDLQRIEKLLKCAVPNQRIRNVETLSGGFINTNLKINFDSDHQPVVLRIYRDGPEVCRKELALHILLEPRLRVPRMFHAEPDGIDDSGPFAIMEYVNAITIEQLKQTNDRAALQQASYSVGKTLAEIGRLQFQKPGRLIGDSGLSVGAPYVEGPNPIPTILDRFLSSPTCVNRIGAELVDRIHNFVWEWASRLRDLENHSSLVHSDFGDRNIMVREEKGAWVVAAVLDWEFAFAGSPLLDVGHFLRYEKDEQALREPHFSRAFVEHGGQLPENWRGVVRLIDLTALVEVLGHDNLPQDVANETLGLIKATLKIISAGGNGSV